MTTRIILSFCVCGIQIQNWCTIKRGLASKTKAWRRKAQLMYKPVEDAVESFHASITSQVMIGLKFHKRNAAYKNGVSILVLEFGWSGFDENLKADVWMVLWFASLMVVSLLKSYIPSKVLHGKRYLMWHRTLLEIVLQIIMKQ